MAHVVTTGFTRADYFLLPEGFPAQLVGGTLVRDAVPACGHQNLASRIHVLLARLVGVDRVAEGPVAVVVDDRNVFGPDVVVHETVPAFDARDVGVPLLVFEIVSPTTARRDRGVKRAGYLRAGVREVWIIDRAAGTVEVHDKDGVRTARSDEPARSRAVAGLVIVPSELFAPPR
jgi:Uma2 family endonuclease